ncbi:helix-turn-helix domain-containing protein [Candidatus Woesearchaeota archaeon]|nr:helix-turn-helix domain-containing protein [Candidatus Woesearchaeota archaeon]
MALAELKSIGLTDGEIKIYEALLELGETTRTQLAKKSGVSPSKIYDVANRLIEKGIISSVKKSGTLHFSAADPKRLLDFVSQKEGEILLEKKKVEELLPQLLLKHKTTEEKTDVEVFYGWEGMQTCFGDLSDASGKGDTIYTFGVYLGEDVPVADRFWQKMYQRWDAKGFKVKIIFNESARGHRAQTEYFEKGRRHEIRYQEQETFMEVDLYKDTVLFVMILKRPMIIRVKSKEAALSFKTYFETMWKSAKK